LTSRVKVKMTVCDREHIIEVIQRDDGDFDLTVETQCDHVREFVEMLGTLSIVDLTDKKNSKVWECVKNARMSSTCLTPAAVINACWLEAGLLSKNLAKSRGSISVEYLD
jgi:hypothetical protein